MEFSAILEQAVPMEKFDVEIIRNVGIDMKDAHLIAVYLELIFSYSDWWKYRLDKILKWEKIYI